MQIPGNNPVYFKNLDALRFISFLGVFLSHTLVNMPDSSMAADFLFFFFSLDYLSVPFFFTLSSFLITYHLLTQKDRMGDVRLPEFYRNRILRIWPVYYLIIIICFLLIPACTSLLNIKAMTLPKFLPFVFFYANFYIIENGSAFTTALVILWSISIEEQFYLTWAPVLKYSSYKWLPVFIMILFTGSIVFSYGYLYLFHNKPGHLAIHSVFILQNFCSGALVAWIAVKKGQLSQYLCNLPRYAWLGIYLALPVGAYFTSNLILSNIIKSICFSLILFDQAINDNRLFNAGASRIINYLGKISYGLYVYHALVIVMVYNGLHFFDYGKTQPYLRNAGEATVTLAITIIAAHFSYRYYESRFLSLKKHGAAVKSNHSALKADMTG